MWKKAWAIAFVAALAAAAGGPAWADGGRHHRHHHHHRHGHLGLYLGVPLGLAWYASQPSYYAPPVVVQPAPQVYIEQPPVRREPAYWYYCSNPQGYYPYVAQCPSGWLRVVPSPS